MRIRVLFILPFLSWLVLTSPRKTTPTPRPTPGSEVSASDWTQVEGCPSEIHITKDGKIVAGKIYYGQGNNLPELSCLGGSKLWYAETKYTSPGGHFIGVGSVIINPGCTLIVFPDYNYAGHYNKISGPRTIPNFLPAHDVRWVASFLWTCKQTYPSCKPADKWQYVTELDNSAETVSAQFTYEKQVGTEWSHSMAQSQSVSATVSAEISAGFWGITAKIGATGTTGYDWTTTDTTTKSEIKSYTVSVTVPPKTNVTIEEVVGFCGGSKIHTQMFRVKDNKGTTKTYQGAMTSYDLTK